jgi:MFS family permease
MPAALPTSSRLLKSMSLLVRPRWADASLVSSLVLVSLGSGLFLPLSLVFFTELTDIPLGLLGAIVGAAGLVTLPVPLIAGRLADRFGAQRLVPVAQLLQACGYVGFVFARDPLTVFLVSALMAVGGRLFWSTIFAALADHAQGAGEATRVHWFAIANIARTAGIAAGGLITGIALSIPGTAPYLILALVAAGCLALSSVLMVPLRHSPSATRFESQPQPQPQPQPHVNVTAFRDRRFVVLLTVNCVFAISTLLLGLTLPTVIKDALAGPGWLTSALLVGNALLVAAFGVLGARAGTARSPFRVLTVAALIWAGGCLLLALGAAIPLPVAAVPLMFAVIGFSAAEILHSPTSVALVTDIAPSARRGQYLALFQYSFIVAEIAGPVMFAALFVENHSSPFVLVLILNLAVIPALTALRRRATPPRSGPSVMRRIAASDRGENR